MTGLQSLLIGIVTEREHEFEIVLRVPKFSVGIAAQLAIRHAVRTSQIAVKNSSSEETDPSIRYLHPVYADCAD